MDNLKKTLLFFLLPLVIIGCNSNPATVVTREPPESIQITSHKVEEGETLFSIAWRYDLRWERLALINSLCHPYLISPGQEITLSSKISPSVGCNNTEYIVEAGDTLYSISTDFEVTLESIADINGLNSPYRINPGEKLVISMGSSSTVRQKNIRPNVERVAKASSPSRPKIEAPKYKTDWEWKWPLKGSVVESFDLGKSRKGIRVKNESSKQINPAAPGNVVYAGSGLRGYGNLVIIKHSDKVLSAYANNEDILVEVGQSITQADPISNLNENQIVYFEIRRDGSPVDPLQFLK